MGKLIIITGTPGVGKSTLAQYLCKHLPAHHFDLHKYYKELSTSYNYQKSCYNINLRKLKKKISQEKKKHPLLIFDSHISHLLPKSFVNLCIVLTNSNLKTLNARLQKRHYSKQKIQENLECEIFQICLEEACEQKHIPIQFENLKKTEFSTIKKQICIRLATSNKPSKSL